MAKVNIKFEKITPFGGLFHVRRLFSRYVGPVIDNVLGLRCTSFGYQYSEIFGSLSSVYFCGGDCVEDVTSHLMPHLSLDPTLRTCSSDTILRGIFRTGHGQYDLHLRYRQKLRFQYCPQTKQPARQGIDKHRPACGR